ATATAPNPAATGVRHGGPRAHGATLVPTTESACSGMVTASLPRRVLCLAAGQQRHDTESGGEACALATSWCLIACLTARTTLRGPHQGEHGRWTVGAYAAHSGVYPSLPCWSGAITRWVYRGSGGSGLLTGASHPRGQEDPSVSSARFAVAFT